MATKTTIQVDQDIVKVLDHMKKERALKSYSETLREILKESKTLTKSELGTLSRLKRFSRDEIDRFD